MFDTIQPLSSETLLNVLSLSENATAIYISQDLHIQYANDAMLAIWDKDRTVVGKTLEEAVPEIKGQPFTELLQNVWRTGKTYKAKDTPADLVVNGMLSTFYFDFVYKAVKNEAGEIFCIIHNATDVTERYKHRQEIKKQAFREQMLNEELASTVEELAASNEELGATNEELMATNEELNDSFLRLADSQNRLRGVMEQAPIGMCVLTGAEMIVEMANDVILKIWGRNAAEVIGKSLYEARPELNGQTVFQLLENVYHTGNTQHNNELKVNLHDNGGLREAYVNSVYQALKDPNGVVNGILIILDEVTEKIKIRQETERVQEMFNMAIEAGELGTFYYNPVTNRFTANDLLKSWFGLQPEEELDLAQATAIIDEEDEPRVTKAIRDALNYESGGNYEIEYTINPLTQKPRVVRAKGKAAFNEQHEPIRLNGTLQDITERKRDEQRKNDFIGMVSHELKTPLTSVSAYLQMLHSRAKKNGDTFEENALDKVLIQVRKMTAMINGFLNVSRLESGKIHIDRQLFDLATLVKEVEEESIATISSHKVIFAPVELTMVKADRDKIGQVINNLISNAVKYSPSNTTIHVSCVSKNGHAEFCVKDQGMGIKKEDQSKLFDRYYRVKGDHMKSISGFGIGLYLCAEIISHHKGKIWVNSEFGQGSTFCFSIPVSQA